MTKSFRATIFCACVAGLLLPASGQNTTPPKPGIHGVLDPATGVFTPTPRAVLDENAAAAAIVPTTGKLVVAFTVKLVTPLPAGGSLFCNVSAIVSDIGTAINNEIIESATTKATVSGATGTCTVTIPYSWILKNAATDTVGLQYSLAMVGTGATAASPFARTSSQFVVPGAGGIKVPANGVTSSFTVAATI